MPVAQSVSSVSDFQRLTPVLHQPFAGQSESSDEWCDDDNHKGSKPQTTWFVANSDTGRVPRDTNIREHHFTVNATHISFVSLPYLSTLRNAVITFCSTEGFVMQII